MAIVKKQKELKLSKTMLAQIASYADDCEQAGWYYGNKERFWKRHEAIKAWLQQELAKESDMLAVHVECLCVNLESEPDRDCSYVQKQSDLSCVDAGVEFNYQCGNCQSVSTITSLDRKAL